MLGLGRASEYAGWWSGGDPQVTIRVATAATGQMSYPDTVSLWSDNSWGSPSSNNLTATVDNSGIVSGNKVTTAYTCRLGAESSYTWTQDPFRTTFDYLAPYNSGTSYDPIFAYLDQGSGSTPTGNPKIARRRSDNRVSFLIEFGGYDYIPLSANVTWSTLEDQWITVIYSSSDNSADFANFNPISGFTTGSQYGSLSMVYTQTGELISSVDYRFNQFNSFPTDWADQTIVYQSPRLGDTALSMQFRNEIGRAHV